MSLCPSTLLAGHGCAMGHLSCCWGLKHISGYCRGSQGSGAKPHCPHCTWDPPLHCPLWTPLSGGFCSSTPHFCVLSRYGRWGGNEHPPQQCLLKIQLAAGAEGRKIPAMRSCGGGVIFLPSRPSEGCSGSQAPPARGDPSPQALVWGFSLFTLWQRLPRTDASVCRDPAEPCKCCRKRAGMYFPAPLGRALRERGCFPGPQKPPLQPRAPPSWGGGSLEPRWGRSAHLGTNFPQIGAQVPSVSKSPSATQGTEHPPSSTGRSGMVSGCHRREERDGEWVSPFGAVGDREAQSSGTRVGPMPEAPLDLGSPSCDSHPKVPPCLCPAVVCAALAGFGRAVT